MPPKHPLLKRLRTNLSTFIQSLDKTSIHIIYFTVDRSDPTKLVANSKNVFLRWNRKDGICYVLPGVSGPWCYVYIGGEESGKVGNHLTFGVQFYEGKCMLELHHTQYFEKDTSSNQYKRVANDCDVVLEGGEETVVPTNRICYFIKTITLEQLFTPSRLSIIQDVSRICYGHYKLEGGIRGKGGRKRLLQGGAVNITEDGFIAFIQKFVLEPVATIRPDLLGVRMLYDERGELGRGSHRNIVILYDFVEAGMHLYLIDAGKAFTAYSAMLEVEQGKSKDMEKAKRCVTEFLGVVGREMQVIREIFEG